jgi:predicted small lipoprotein YifL
MNKAYIFILLSIFTATGCGVKGAPMPRRDEVFIEKTLIQSEEVKKEESLDEKAKDKTTILPKKDPR